MNLGRWPAIAYLVRFSKPFVAFARRRPAVALITASLAIFLCPLVLEVGLTLLYLVPSRLRWMAGELVFAALMAVGLWRIWLVRPADTWPTPPGPDEVRGAWDAARWMPWALQLVIASLIVPIMRNPDGLGFADWDFVMDKFEAARRTILEWGQFPWWNPWCRGGFPLAAEPQIGAISMATPLVLTLGTTIGLRVAAILCLMIAIMGAYRLAELWLREPWSAAAAALVYGLNGGVVVNMTQCYVIAMSYCSLPWLAYYAFRIGERFSDGLWLGFWLAFAVLNGIQYPTLYAGLLLLVVWLRAVRVQAAGQRLRLLWNTVAAVGLCWALCGWRLITVLLVLLEDRREKVTEWDESPLAMIDHLLTRPLSDWPEVIPPQHWATFHSLTFYVGPLVFVLGLVSLRWGWRWWHTLALAGFWLALGSVRWYHPSRWLMSWPFIGSAHIVTRWEYVALLGLGLAAGSVLERLRQSRRRFPRVLAIMLVATIGADFVDLAYQQFPLAFHLQPDPRLYPGPPVPDIVSVGDGMGYTCTARGYGVIRGYEPMLSYYRNAPTLRRGREEPGYRGEFWTAEASIRPTFWSPNRMVFQVAPGQDVFINQNPGSWWRVNGQPVFAGHRCAEPMVPFIVKADATGRLELRIHPRGLELGLAVQGLGAVMLLAAWLGRRRVGPGVADPTEGQA